MWSADRACEDVSADPTVVAVWMVVLRVAVIDRHQGQDAHPPNGKSLHREREACCKPLATGKRRLVAVSHRPLLYRLVLMSELFCSQLVAQATVKRSCEAVTQAVADASPETRAHTCVPWGRGGKP